jgi:hypothetical protein
MVISIGVSLVALCRFLWFWVGYGLSEAFNRIFPHPEDLAAKGQLRLWGIYLLVAVAVSFRLFQTYRRNYRKK